MKHKFLFSVVALCLILLASHSAYAHKIIASVFISGNTIEGEIAFSNGDFAKNVVVEVFDEENNKLGETKTDEEGFFVFTPSKQITHIFKANLGAGHIANARMEASELPLAQTAAVSPAAATPASAQKVAPIPAQQLEDTRSMLRKIIKQEITPLRKELMAYKEKNNIQTILGGIGYIMGLFGLFFYLAARRKLKQS